MSNTQRVIELNGLADNLSDDSTRASPMSEVGSPAWPSMDGGGLVTGHVDHLGSRVIYEVPHYGWDLNTGTAMRSGGVAPAPTLDDGGLPAARDASANVVVVDRKAARRCGTVRVSQQWEGRVESFDDTEIHALLRDMTGSAGVEAATIPRNIVSDADSHLVCVGALFYMTVGVKKSAAGTIENTMWLKFARIPVGEIVAEATTRDKTAKWRSILGLE